MVFRKQPVGVVEPLSSSHFRRQRTDLREVALKGREASAGVDANSSSGQILSEIRFHKGEEINFPGTAEIE